MLYEGLFAKTRQIRQASQIPGIPLSKTFFFGFLTGIIGLGGNYALVPSYIYFLKAPVKLAIGTYMAAFIWMALVGALFKLFSRSC